MEDNETNWVEFAQKIARDARASVVAEKNRLKEALAENQRKQSSAINTPSR
jgi:hypothetical protein